MANPNGLHQKIPAGKPPNAIFDHFPVVFMLYTFKLFNWTTYQIEWPDGWEVITVREIPG